MFAYSGREVYEIMTKEKRYYEKQRFAQRRMWMLLAILFITIGSAVFGSSFSDAHGNAQESPITYKYYKSIVIQPGDTLWDIALEYKTDDYGSTQEYVDELKEINSLESDSIQESQYLMIAYYDEEFR